MKTNSNIKRLSALILAGSIAVLTASAADTTTPAMDKPATKRHLPVGNASAARKSAPLAKTGRAMSATTSEPGRIFNALTKSFEINPNYHEPPGAMEGTRRPNREAEPDRIFDPETRNFEPNPAFGFRW